MISSEDVQPKCFSTSSAAPAGFFTPIIMNQMQSLSVTSYNAQNQENKTESLADRSMNLLSLNTLIPISASNALAFESS